MFPRQRLDAEQIRDSLLQAAGLLDETLGGPPVYPPQPAMANQAGFNENTWKTSENPRDQNRRSVYIYVKRNNPYPLLDTFDWANPQSVHGKREVTTTAPQALALINSDLVYSWSQVLAGRAIREAGEKDNKRVARLFEILYAREPSKEETKTLLAFLDSQEKLLAAQLAEGKKIVAPDGYGENPQVGVELDQLYKTLYGRERGSLREGRAGRRSSRSSRSRRAARRAADAPRPKLRSTRMRRAPRPSSTWRTRSRTRTNSATASNYSGNHHDTQYISQRSSHRRRPRCWRPGARRTARRAARSRSQAAANYIDPLAPKQPHFPGEGEIGDLAAHGRRAEHARPVRLQAAADQAARPAAAGVVLARTSRPRPTAAWAR